MLDIGVSAPCIGGHIRATWYLCFFVCVVYFAVAASVGSFKIVFELVSTDAGGRFVRIGSARIESVQHWAGEEQSSNCDDESCDMPWCVDRYEYRFRCEDPVLSRLAPDWQTAEGRLTESRLRNRGACAGEPSTALFSTADHPTCWMPSVLRDAQMTHSYAAALRAVQERLHQETYECGATLCLKITTPIGTAYDRALSGFAALVLLCLGWYLLGWLVLYGPPDLRALWQFCSGRKETYACPDSVGTLCSDLVKGFASACAFLFPCLGGSNS